MAYKPQNIATYRNDSSKYSRGSATGKGGAMVPGTTGSNDRGSQGDAHEFMDQGQTRRENPDYALLGNENNPRNNPNMGKRSYSAETPTL